MVLKSWTVRPGAAAVVLALVAAPGCAVLTKSQVDEVKRFAQATDAYTELPGAAITSYGTLRRDLMLLDVANAPLDKRNAAGGFDPAPARDAWQRVEKAYDQEQQYADEARQLDAQLAVLTLYAEILNRVVSDDYTDALGESAARLGSSLDSATNAYNKEFRAGKSPLKDVGGEIAQVIRAAGGLYIRHRQAVILRDTVKTADPLIQGLMDDVTSTANTMADSFANQEQNVLRPEFVTLARRSGKVDLGTLSALHDDLAEARAGGLLAKQIAASAQTYKKAHARLVAETATKKDLDGLIQEIQTLRQEIAAAKKVKKKAEK